MSVRGGDRSHDGRCAASGADRPELMPPICPAKISRRDELREPMPRRGRGARGAQACAYDSGMANLRETMRRHREARRKLLTRGERIFGWSFSMLPPILVFIGVLLLISGGTLAVGIALLILGLLMLAVPTSPILRARVRRREGRRE
jgi:hypothetical protein